MLGYYLDLAWRRGRKGLAMVLLLVLTMAIGIASCMTAMTIFDALSGEPIPGISDHLYVVSMDARESIDKNNNGYDRPDSLLKLRDAQALLDTHRTFRQVALAQSLERVSDPTGKHSDQVMGLMADGPVLGTLGIALRYGRAWSVAEQAARTPVIIIDTTLAEKLFGQANVVGKSVSFGTRQFRVIGVTAPWKPRMVLLDLTQNRGNLLGQELKFFVPVGAALDAGVGPFSSGLCGKDAPVISFQTAKVEHCRWIETWVALDSDKQVKAYSQFLSGYAQSQHDAGRFAYPPHARLYAARTWMSKNHVVPDDVGLNLLLAGGFLLLCMINVAGLLAARFLRRRSDVAVRRALGAARRHIFAQHLVESGLLGVAGGVLALPLTLFGLWVVRMQPVAYADAAKFGFGVFGALLALSVAVGLVVGILPAWRVCREPPAVQVKLV